MSIWVERFRTHPLHERVKQFGSELENIKEKAVKAGAECLEHYERLCQIYRYVRDRIQRVDPALMPLPSLSAADTHVNNALAQLVEFKKNGNVGHLQNANSQADVILQTVAQLPSLSDVEGIDGVKEAVASFRMSAAQLLRYLESDMASLRGDLDTAKSNAKELTDEIKAQKGRLDQAIAEFQQQFSQQESKRSEQFLTAEKSRTDQYAANVDSRREQWERQRDEHKAETEKTREAFKTRFELFLNEQEKVFLEKADSFTAQSDGVLESLEQSKAHAEKLVGVISNTGMIGGFQKIANEEQKSARIFQAMAVIAMLGLIIFAVMAYSSTTGATFDIGRFSARAFAALAFGILAAYAAKQADHHQKSERRNRQIELELAALGPFLAALPEDQQHSIKRDYADRIFGKQADLSADDVLSTAGPGGELLKSALQTIQRLAPKG